MGTLLFANLEDSEAEHENIIIVYSPSYDWVILKPLTLDWSIGYVLDEEASVTIKTHGNEDFGEQDTPWGKRYIADYARFVYYEAHNAT